MTKANNSVTKTNNQVAKTKNPVTKTNNQVEKTKNQVNKGSNPVVKDNPVTKGSNPVVKDNQVTKSNNPVVKDNPVTKSNNPVVKTNEPVVEEVKNTNNLVAENSNESDGSATAEPTYTNLTLQNTIDNAGDVYDGGRQAVNLGGDVVGEAQNIFSEGKTIFSSIMDGVRDVNIKGFMGGNFLSMIPRSDAEVPDEEVGRELPRVPSMNEEEAKRNMFMAC